MDRFWTALNAVPEYQLARATTHLVDYLVASGKVDETGFRLMADLLRYLMGEISSAALAGKADMCDLSTEDTRHDIVGVVLGALIFPWMGGYCAEAIGGDPTDKFWAPANDITGTKADKFAEEWRLKAATFLEEWNYYREHIDPFRYTRECPSCGRRSPRKFCECGYEEGRDE